MAGREQLSASSRGTHAHACGIHTIPPPKNLHPVFNHSSLITPDSVRAAAGVAPGYNLTDLLLVPPDTGACPWPPLADLRGKVLFAVIFHEGAWAGTPLPSGCVWPPLSRAPWGSARALWQQSLDPCHDPEHPASTRAEFQVAEYEALHPNEEGALLWLVSDTLDLPQVRRRAYA